MPPRKIPDDDLAVAAKAGKLTPPPNAKRAAPPDTPLGVRTTAEPAKRGRGRPSGTKIRSKAAAPAPARPRGRPKKTTEEPLDASEMPVKRGSGRPKKSAGDEPAQHKSGRAKKNPEAAQPETPVRRGPGRPRKNQTPDGPAITPVHSPAASAASPQSSASRGPGRPRKHTEPPLDDPLATPVRRGPGRPRKHADTPTDPLTTPVRKAGRAKKPCSPTPSPARRKRTVAESLSDVDSRPAQHSQAKRARTEPPANDLIVDIVSPARFAKARAAVPTLERMRSADSDETMRWRRKFEDLSALRVTQAEKTLAELQKSAQKQTASAEAVISALRKENEELRRQIKKDGEKQQDPAELETRKALEKDVKVLQQQVETLSLDLVTKDAQIEQLEHHQRLAETSVDFNLRDSLRILQMISGLTIEEVVPEDQGMSYKCLQAGPTLTIGYVLTVFDDLPEEFQYTPYEETAELDVLPDFLRETMSFSQDSASLFFWRVCDHLNQIALQEPATNGNL